MNRKTELIFYGEQKKIAIRATATWPGSGWRLSGLTGAAYQMKGVLAMREKVFEGQVLYTHYGKEGQTGRIEDVERFLSNNVNSFVDALVSYIAKEICSLWPSVYTVEELQKTPRRAVLTITLERKECKCYGK